MTESVNELMERASLALVQMDYAKSEELAMQALALCINASDWTTYARVIMPLQEARRQRRLTACDAGVSCGGIESLPAASGVWIAVDVSREDAAQIDDQARAEGKAIEVLWVTKQNDSQWTVSSFAGPTVSVQVTAPNVKPDTEGHTPPDDAWYLYASEALGDAVIAGCTHPVGSIERVVALQADLAAVLDHEKLHQALAEAARQAAMAAASPQ